jgi:hypothetical protein
LVTVIANTIAAILKGIKQIRRRKKKKKKKKGNLSAQEKTKI